MTKPFSIVRVNSRVSAQNWFQEFNQALPSSVSSYLKVEMQKWQESFRPRFQDRIFQKIWILKVFLEIESNEIRKLGWANARLSKDDKDPQSASLYKLPPMKTGFNRFLPIPLIMSNTRQNIPSLIDHVFYLCLCLYLYLCQRMTLILSLKLFINSNLNAIVLII